MIILALLVTVWEKEHISRGLQCNSFESESPYCYGTGFFVFVFVFSQDRLMFYHLQQLISYSFFYIEGHDSKK